MDEMGGFDDYGYSGETKGRNYYPSEPVISKNNKVSVAVATKHDDSQENKPNKANMGHPHSKMIMYNGKMYDYHSTIPRVEKKENGINMNYMIGAIVGSLLIFKLME